MPDQEEPKNPVKPPKPNPNADNTQQKDQPSPKQTASPEPNQAAENTVDFGEDNGE